MSTARAVDASRLQAPRVVRWMGNKTAHVAEIRQAIASLAEAGSLVVDPMAGSQTVGLALKDRHRLLASDAQAASAAIGRAFLDNVDVPGADAAFVDKLAARAAGRGTSADPGFLETSYPNASFSTEQCRALDTLRAALDEIAPAPADPRRDLALCALMLAACRAQASPGHFAQHLRPDHPRTLALRRIDVTQVALLALRSFRVVPGLCGSRSLALPWRDLVVQHSLRLAEAEAWYVDPPYTRDQYSRFYHLLETIVLADDPALGSQAARLREDRHRSAFCSPRRAAPELRDLLATVRDLSPRAGVVLSYSARGVMSREDLESSARGLFRIASFRELAHEYSTQGKGRLRGVVEWLLVLRRV